MTGIFIIQGFSTFNRSLKHRVKVKTKRSVIEQICQEYLLYRVSQLSIEG
jgi:hypothetical protein